MDQVKRDEARKVISEVVSQDDYEKKVRWLISTFRGLEVARLWPRETTAKAIGCVLVLDGVAQGKIKLAKPATPVTPQVQSKS